MAEDNIVDPQDQNQQNDSSYEDIYDNINVDDVSVSGLDTADYIQTEEDEDPAIQALIDAERQKAESKNQKIEKTQNPTPKTPEKTVPDTQLDVGDISAYIASTKAKHQEKREKMIAPDGTELSELPGLYAIVPHSKGDHKLVYLTSDAPDKLIPDDKGRDKGTTYTKNNTKIYDVHLKMLQHPSIRDESGDLMDAWVIDTPAELTAQLNAISAGKGGGFNFGEPVIVKQADTTETPQSPTQPEESTPEIVSKPATTDGPKKVEKEATPTQQPTKPLEKKPATDDKDTAQTTKSTPPQEQQATPTKPGNSKPVTQENNPAKTEVKPETAEKPVAKEEPKKIEETDKGPETVEEKVSPTVQKPEPTAPVAQEKTPSPVEDTKPEPAPQPDPIPETNQIDKTPAGERKGGFGLNNRDEQTEKKLTPTVPVQTTGKSGMFKSQDEAEKESKKKQAQQPTPAPTPTSPATEIPQTTQQEPKQETYTEPKAAPTAKDKAEAPSKPVPKQETTPETGPTTPDEVTQPASKTAVIDLEDIGPQENKEQNKPSDAPKKTDIPPSQEHAVIDLDTIETPAAPHKTKKKVKKRKESKPPYKLIIKIVLFVFVVVLGIVFYRVMFSVTPSDSGQDTTPPPVVNNTDDAQLISGLANLPEQDTGDVVDDTNTEPIGTQFTLDQLQSKIEAQELEARKLLNRAKIVRNQQAIKFGLAAMIRAGNALEKIETDSTVTADEMEKEAEAIDRYIQQIVETME